MFWQMFIEQNKMKRQSQLLLQNSAPDQQLLKALDDNARLTHTLEEERLQHQQKVKQDYFSSHAEVFESLLNLRSVMYLLCSELFEILSPIRVHNLKTKLQRRL